MNAKMFSLMSVLSLLIVFSSCDDNECPDSWTFDENYPNICYKWVGDEWYLSGFARNNCSERHKGATLPIFRSQSEYISYSRLWNTHKPMACDFSTWLGLAYSNFSKSYIWDDGSKLNFSMPIDDADVDQNIVIVHDSAGSDWRAHGIKEARAVCQLRLGESDNNTVTYQYPKDPRCSNVDNWFYDAVSDICYYFDRTQEATWSEADTFCKDVAHGSLPFFISNFEHDNYNTLLRNLQLSCTSNTWLGYKNETGVYLTVNGTIPAFLNWQPGAPHSDTGANYVFSWGWNPLMTDHNWGNENSTFQTRFLCQYRPSYAPNE